MRIHFKAFLRCRTFLKSANPDQRDIEINENGESQDQSYAIVAEFLQTAHIKLIKPLYTPDEFSQESPPDDLTT